MGKTIKANRQHDRQKCLDFLKTCKTADDMHQASLLIADYNKKYGNDEDVTDASTKKYRGIIVANFFD